MEGDRLCLCSESLDSALENNDLHIIVSAFYFARLNGSIFFMRLEQKKKAIFMSFSCQGTSTALWHRRLLQHSFSIV
jgi:hypothetical protein